MTRGLFYAAASALFCFDFMMPPNAAVQTRTTFEVGSTITATVWRSSAVVRVGIAIVLTVVSISAWIAVFGKASLAADVRSLEVTASMLFVAGYSLRIWAKRTLGCHFTYEIQRPEVLISHGPYEVVLHPSYTGFVLEWGCLLAFWLPLPLGPTYTPLPFACALMFGAYAAGFAFLWVWRTKREEVVMRSVFGKRWDQHVARVRWRFIPLVF
jgi:protein-S-isoprenylcysteine O-methyltransferase Ste14